MLQAFHVANQFSHGKYLPMVDAMRGVMLDKALALCALTDPDPW